MPARPTHADYLRAPRFASIDGLRCLAVIPVVWHHATPRPLSGFLGRGPLGVDLFFVISGYLITTLLLRERRAFGTVSVGRFYARRSLRIFPAYYLVLGLTALRAIAWMPLGATRNHFLANLPYWATYSANWFVDFDVGYPVAFAFAWSLATEEQFYAVWPWFARAPRWMMPAVAMVLLALHEGMLRAWFGADWPPLVRRIVASLAPGICMGALLACLLDGRRGFAMFAPAIGARIASPVALVVLVVLVAEGRAPFLAIVAAMTLLVGACVVRADHGMRSVLEARPLRFLASISYELYLVHVAVITAVKRLAPDVHALADDAPFVFTVGLGIAIPLAYGLHCLVGRPLEALRARLRGHGRAARAQSST